MLPGASGGGGREAGGENPLQCSEAPAEGSRHRPFSVAGGSQLMAWNQLLFLFQVQIFGSFKTGLYLPTR